MGRVGSARRRRRRRGARVGLRAARRARDVAHGARPVPLGRRSQAL